MSNRGRGRLGKPMWKGLKKEKTPPGVVKFSKKDFDFRIGTDDKNNIVLSFGIPVAWIGMPVAEAEWAGKTILEMVERAKNHVPGEVFSKCPVQHAVGEDYPEEGRACLGDPPPEPPAGNEGPGPLQGPG